MKGDLLWKCSIHLSRQRVQSPAHLVQSLIYQIQSHVHLAQLYVCLVAVKGDNKITKIAHSWLRRELPYAFLDTSKVLANQNEGSSHFS